jgi:hypothetical protein
MTVTINLKPEVEAVLQKRAIAIGCENLAEYLEKYLEKDIDREANLDKFLAPIRKNFSESGMNEDDLDALIESERQEMWEEKNGLQNL